MFQLEVDLQQFFRRLRLKEFLAEKAGNDTEYNPFKNKSNWTPPPNRDPALEAYIKAVEKDAMKSVCSSGRSCSRDNFTSQEREVLSSLHT